MQGARPSTTYSNTSNESLSLTTIVLWPILYRTQGESLSLHLSIFLSFLNVGSRSSPIMILENRIRLIEIQLRCQTLFNSPGNKLGRGGGEG